METKNKNEKSLIDRIFESKLYQKIKNTYLGRLIIDLIDIYIAQRISKSSLAVAFSFTISIFPFLICLNWVIGVLSIDISQASGMLRNLVPAGILDILASYFSSLTNSNTIYLFIIGLYMTVRIMSSGFNNIFNSVDDIYVRRGYGGIKRFLLSYLLPILFLIGISIGITIIVIGSWFTIILDRFFEIEFFAPNWTILRFLILFFLLFIMFWALYWYMAPKKYLNKKMTTISALTGASVLVIASMIYSLIMSASARYSLIYGSLASFIILMLWINTLSLIIIMGSLLNYLISKYAVEGRFEDTEKITKLDGKDITVDSEEGENNEDTNH